MRLQGTLSGEGGGYNWENLYYLSLHTLDSKIGVQYGRTRVSRELLDGWLSKRISFDGKKFQDADVTLTDEEHGRACSHVFSNHAPRLDPI